MAWAWRNPRSGRWYEARIIRNVFDETCLLAIWGGSGHRAVGHQLYLVPTRDALRQKVKELHLRRRGHGYHPTHLIRE